MLADRLVYFKLDESNTIYKISRLHDMLIRGNNINCFEREYYECLNEIVDLSVSHGFYNNLWQLTIAHFLVNSENAYSLSCEMIGDCGGAISKTALRDFEIVKDIFSIDLKDFDKIFPYDYETLSCFDAKENTGYKFNKRIRDCIVDLASDLANAKDAKEFMMLVADFYKAFGVGKLGLHKAFRIKPGGEIVPVSNITHVNLDDLIGYESQKKKLIDNTESFLQGRVANNCLLFGDSGTGKSTSIKAICNEYYDDGLRLIEIYKHQLLDVHNVIAQIKSRKYKFILYMDDLSFEEFETEYKYLKAVIEGGLEKKPDNVLIYATSNRRHLIKESFKDKDDYDDLHKNDTISEKLSLSYRFGVTIYYGSPSKKEFNDIVLGLKEQYQLEIEDDVLLAEANKWELSHGGLSGRCARQFIDYMKGVGI